MVLFTDEADKSQGNEAKKLLSICTWDAQPALPLLRVNFPVVFPAISFEVHRTHLSSQYPRASALYYYSHGLLPTTSRNSLNLT